MKTSTLIIIGAALLALGIVALVIVSRPQPEKKLDITALAKIWGAYYTGGAA